MLKGIPQANCIFHWYSGPISLLDRLINEGHYLSVNTVMVGTKTGRKIINAMPRDRILTESDGPYAIFHGRPAKPTDMNFILKHLGAIWALSPGRAEQEISKNIRQLLQPLKESLKHTKY